MRLVPPAASARRVFVAALVLTLAGLARFARAHCLEALGRETRARGAYQGVLAREPAHFGALTNLGTLYFTAGDFNRARVLYEQAIADGTASGPG